VTAPISAAPVALPATATLAQRLLAWFPLLLFMPQGVVNGGVMIYLVLLLFAGDWRARWSELRAHPLLPPALGMLALCVLSGLLLGRAEDFATGFVHYQDYLFLFLFLAAGSGAWQQQAVRNFYLAATIAAGLLFLARATLLPTWGVLAAYNKYSGNKSILIGILLAMAACWMLAELVQNRQRDSQRPWKHEWKPILRWLFVALAVVLVAKSRTAQLLLLLGSVGILLAAMRNWPQRLLALVACALLTVAVVQAVPSIAHRLAGTVADVRAFAGGGVVSSDGERLELFHVTTDLIAEKPLTGHGIGAWFPTYRERIQNTAVPLHSTPHNDYLLHLSELGVPGLLMLLWAFWVQAAQCRRLPADMAKRLAILSLAIPLAGLFNAILRDFAFAFPFMYLLAIPLTGVRRAGTAP
jgi:O-antigen ligase